MKKIIVSAGLVTVSVVGLQAVDAPGLTRTQTSKWWSVSAALRGFYDGNPETLPSSQNPEGSFGIDFSPTFSANFPREQTYIGMSVRYDMKWYENRPNHQVDQSVEFLGKLDHKFSPRYNLSADEFFAYSDEPSVLANGGPTAVPQRTDASGMRNNFNLKFNATLTELLGAELGFNNNWYDYSQSASDAAQEAGGPTGTNPFGIGSRAALLNRIEYQPYINARYQVNQDWVAFVGYQFGFADYLSSDPIAFDTSTLQFVPGSIRQSQSQYMYVGSDYSVTDRLLASGKAGAQYIKFNDISSDSASWSPYFDVSASYQYLPGDSLKAGVTYSSFATDVAAPSYTIAGLNDITTDQQALLFYASVNHRITPLLTGIILGSAQRSEFQNGTYGGENEWYYLVGASLDYKINQFLSAEVGYTLDLLDSQLPNRNFTRNRGFVGVRATY